MTAQRQRVMCIFGTRPEAIKMAPLVLALQQRSERFATQVVVTAQHRALLDQVLQHFGITPDHDLNLMQARQSPLQVLALALQGLGELIARERPDLVLVHGDTVTTVAGAMAAFFQQVSVGHVEAGLRSFNKWAPFPEEINRRFAGVAADLQFAPTETNRQNLLREGVAPVSIHVTGNTVIDALQLTVRSDHRFVDPVLAAADLAGHRVITVTAHRRENWGERHARLFRAMRAVVDRYPDTLLVYPVHPGPEVRRQVHLLQGHPRILLLEPLSYPDMVNLMARSYLVFTDSGGLQEETPSLGVPLLLLRDTTERPEAVTAGVVRVVGTGGEQLESEAGRLLADPAAHREMARRANPYGDGRAAERIVQAIEHHFGLAPEPPAAFAAGQS